MEKLYQSIKERLATAKPNKVFAVFDFDNTCVVGDIAEAVLDYMASNNLFRGNSVLIKGNKLSKSELSKKIYENYYKLLNKGNFKSAYKFITKTLSGFTVKEINNLVGEVLKLGTIKPRHDVIALMDYLKTNKVDIWIISASSVFLLSPAMKHFNIQANFIGMDSFVKNGVLTSLLRRPMPLINGKVKCIKKFINKKIKPILTIGDSINDLPMLEYSDIKVVIDRNNDLKKIALDNNWFIFK